jgi:hypothetical protein
VGSCHSSVAKVRRAADSGCAHAQPPHHRPSATGCQLAGPGRSATGKGARDLWMGRAGEY